MRLSYLLMTILRELRDCLHTLIYRSPYPIIELYIHDILKYCEKKDYEIIGDTPPVFRINKNRFKPNLILTENDHKLIIKLYHNGLYVFITLVLTTSGHVSVSSETYKAVFEWSVGGKQTSVTTTATTTTASRDISPNKVPFVEIDIAKNEVLYELRHATTF